MDSILAGSSCLQSGRTWESRKAIRGESRREREFYRYYGPFRQMSNLGPKYCDVRNPAARAEHKPIACPDKILTALCQLGALRMKARRCLIFFFDVNHAYIMAEATKTLSLEDEANFGPGDQLWMGHSVIPRDIACCETTVNLPSFPVSAAAADAGDLNNCAFIVNDLTRHPDLSHRPYVTGFPDGRFYAGVPITSPSGVNIGAYCILDDEVRDGVSKEELMFLGDMSQTVVAHLETVRGMFEQQQSNRMVAGLGAFVRNASDGEKATHATDMPLNDDGARMRASSNVEYRLPDALIDTSMTLARRSPPRDDAPKQSIKTSASAVDEKTPSRPAREFTDAASVDEWQNPFLDRQMRADTWGKPNASPSMAKKNEANSTNRERNEAQTTKHIYQRAAETLCQALDVDGVAFLDATVRGFGGLSEAQNTNTAGGTISDSVDTHSASDPSASADDSRAGCKRVCRVLGCAQTLPDARPDEGESSGRKPATKLEESFLRDLMRREPKGKVWTYDEDLKTHSDDGFSSEDNDSGVMSPSTPVHQTARRQRRSDAEVLQSAFPGARCVALHGIYDATRKRWVVGGLYWTFDPLRHISSGTEMHFVSAFCDIIVAETKRLEVLGSDKAKSDFISSLSHELRSPLHGILGSFELLSEQETDDTTSSLIEQVGSCGRSLLEIIDHLLEFADLKRQEPKKGTVKSSRIRQGLLSTTSGSVTRDDLKTLRMSVALDEVTEDAVVAAVYSYHYSQGASQRILAPVILDIDQPNSDAWSCSLAVGGWKRICMNLVTNSMKYTPSGFIRVSLKQISRPTSRQKYEAKLTVTDSGSGMSKEFQKNHLFHDFSQENSLSDGLGLGLNMVSRMVHAMGGKIDVTSDQEGTGTRVTVLVPLEHRKSSQDRSASVSKVLTGLKVGLLTGTQKSPTSRDDVMADTASAMAITSIEKKLTFLGAQPERCQWRSEYSCDIKFLMEAQAADYLSSIRDRKGTVAFAQSNPAPVAVVCDTFASAQRLRDHWKQDELSSQVVVEHVSLPCSLKQIVRAVSSAIRLQQDRKSAPSTILDLQKGSQMERLPAESPPPLDMSLPTVPERQQTPSPRPFARSNTLLVDEDEFMSPPPPSNNASVPPMNRRPDQPPLTHFPKSRGSSPQSPAQPVAVNVEPKAASPTPFAVPATRRDPLLLLVDDNNINLKLLTTFAKRRKYPHITAADGQLALDAYKTAHKSATSQDDVDDNDRTGARTPNVVLMDINMPVMDGYEAVQRIRAYEKEQRIVASKIIAVTALQSEAAHVEALGSGFDCFMSKPIKLKDLANLVDACCAD